MILWVMIIINDRKLKKNPFKFMFFLWQLMLAVFSTFKAYVAILNSKLSEFTVKCQSLLNKINDNISYNSNSEERYTIFREVDRAMRPFQMALSLV